MAGLTPTDLSHDALSTNTPRNSVGCGGEEWRAIQETVQWIHTLHSSPSHHFLTSHFPCAHSVHAGSEGPRTQKFVLLLSTCTPALGNSALRPEDTSLFTTFQKDPGDIFKLWASLYTWEKLCSELGYYRCAGQYDFLREFIIHDPAQTNKVATLTCLLTMKRKILLGRITISWKYFFFFELIFKMMDDLYSKCHKYLGQLDSCFKFKPCVPENVLGTLKEIISNLPRNLEI